LLLLTLKLVTLRLPSDRIEFEEAAAQFDKEEMLLLLLTSQLVAIRLPKD